MNCAVTYDSLLQSESMVLPGGIRWGTVQVSGFLGRR